MGRRGEHNRLIDEASLRSSNTQHEIANAIALNLHGLDRSAGVKLTQAMKPIRSGILAATDPAAAAGAAPSQSTVNATAKGWICHDLRTHSRTQPRNNEQKWQNR
jgi:hypothetical protein